MHNCRLFSTCAFTRLNLDIIVTVSCDLVSCDWFNWPYYRCTIPDSITWPSYIVYILWCNLKCYLLLWASPRNPFLNLQCSLLMIYIYMMMFHGWLRVFVCVCVYMSACLYLCVCVCVCETQMSTATYFYVDAELCMETHVQTHTHTHTHTHMFTQMQTWMSIHKHTNLCLLINEKPSSYRFCVTMKLFVDVTIQVFG